MFCSLSLFVCALLTMLCRGDEFGYFSFGGSTVLVIFEPNTVVFDQDLVANSARPLETLVAVGQSLARRAESVPRTAPTTPQQIMKSAAEDSASPVACLLSALVPFSAMFISFSL